jgi:predicted branched-subunit amino acid permease
VWLAMTGIFIALAVDSWVATAVLLVGLVALVFATVLYARVGLGRVARGR